MYELIIKILNEKDLKKYTIKDIQEMKEILKDVKTEMVRLRRINEQVTENNLSLRIRESKEKTNRRSL